MISTEKATVEQTDLDADVCTDDDHGTTPAGVTFQWEHNQFSEPVFNFCRSTRFSVGIREAETTNRYLVT